MTTSNCSGRHNRHHVRNCGLVSGDACVVCIMFPLTGSFPDGMYDEADEMVEILVVSARSTVPAATLATGTYEYS